LKFPQNVNFAIKASVAAWCIHRAKTRRRFRHPIFPSARGRLLRKWFVCDELLGASWQSKIENVPGGMMFLALLRRLGDSASIQRPLTKNDAEQG
jgi:hypothetical protein